MAHRQVKRALALAVGWTLIGFGIVGLFLPVLQGMLVILLGLYVLSRESKTARRILGRFRDKYPDAYAAMKRTKIRATAAWDRLRGGNPTPDEDEPQGLQGKKRKAESGSAGHRS